ncbi:MAG: glycosyltransferase family 39 protein [Candidatus Lernaella stagnicola]|nr:glycosyltransferase family 39 protein [Candidatus Lernaella stagnicola]
MQPSRKQRVLFLFALALATFFRLSNLGGPPLWGDETLAAGAQYLSLDSLFDELRNRDSIKAPIDPPGYHLLNRWFHPLLADPAKAMFTATGRFFLRLLSALSGIALVGAVLLLVRQLGERDRAWLPALLVAFSFYGVYYSQENRPYAAVALTAVVSAWLLLRLVESADRRLVPAYAVCLALTAYLHYVAAMVLAAHLLVLAASYLLPRSEGHEWKGRTWAWVGLALGAALYLPWLGQTLNLAVRPELFQPHISEAGGDVPAAWRMLGAALLHVGCGSTASLVFYAPLAVFGFVGVWRRERLGALLIAAHYAVPVMYLAASGFGQFFHPRYLIFIFPMHQLLAGWGIVEITIASANRRAVLRRRPWLVPAAFLIVLFALNAMALGEYYRYGIKCASDAPAFAEFCARYIESF